MIYRDDFLDGNPSEQGWYAVCITIPEDTGEIEAAFWDGTAWSWEKESTIYKVVWAYDRKFNSKDETQAWIDAGCKRSAHE